MTTFEYISQKRISKQKSKESSKKEETKKNENCNQNLRDYGDQSKDYADESRSNGIQSKVYANSSKSSGERALDCMEEEKDNEIEYSINRSQNLSFDLQDIESKHKDVEVLGLQVQLPSKYNSQKTMNRIYKAGDFVVDDDIQDNESKFKDVAVLGLQVQVPSNYNSQKSVKRIFKANNFIDNNENVIQDASGSSICKHD